MSITIERERSTSLELGTSLGTEEIKGLECRLVVVEDGREEIFV